MATADSAVGPAIVKAPAKTPPQTDLVAPVKAAFRDSPEPTEAVIRESAERTEASPTNSSESVDGDAPFWPDETAEVAFLSDAKERGETTTAVAPVKAAGSNEDSETKAALPPLDEMVKRIPPAVRETLEELFRAKFVSVKRVPKKSLKS